MLQIFTFFQWNYCFKFKLNVLTTLLLNLLFFAALNNLVCSLKETENLSGDQELEFLQSLLASKELNALVSVHSKVAKICQNERLAPLISTSMQVSVALFIEKKIITIFTPSDCIGSARTSITAMPCISNVQRNICVVTNTTHSSKKHLKLQINYYWQFSSNNTLELVVCPWCYCSKGLLSTFTRHTNRSGRRWRNCKNCTTC